MEKDPELVRILSQLTMSGNGERVATIPELRARVRQEQPKNLFLINQVIRSFTPKLVLNMVEDPSGVNSVVWRIQEVADKMLCTKVDFVGSLPLEGAAKRSARDLFPVVAKSPRGDYAKNLTAIAEMVNLRVSA
ncbi:MAG: MinD/ParA family protein [Syntrophobacteraceae bacterium]|nr:MinD/ParA family protein [Syntrophobacteraceae bacterium]